MNHKKWKFMKNNYQLYLMLLPGLLLLLVFKYVPMYGIIIAFKDYSPIRGIMGSDWVGLEYFRRFLTLPTFNQLFGNTVLLSFYGMVFGFIAPIVLALILNQIRHVGLKKNIQLIVYAPNFISTVIVVGMLFLLLSPVGPVNNLMEAMGMERAMFMTDAAYFRTVYVVSGIWQTAGWSSIIYLATLSGIGPELIEAAKVDGANVMQRIFHIDLPTLRPVSAIIFILSVGGIMSIGFEKAYLMQTSLNLPRSEILATYLYKVGLQMGDYSYSTAVGLFNAVINVILLLSVNFVVKRLNEGEGI
ncbi:ABC transporter permease [Anaerotalea alkaliphila]|nr:ABC transporter permease subunit [Anaerotalea alkaliphila]